MCSKDESFGHSRLERDYCTSRFPARSSSTESPTRSLPARSSSAVEKQAGEDAWKLNERERALLPARSSSEVEKQAG